MTHDDTNYFAERRSGGHLFATTAGTLLNIAKSTVCEFLTGLQNIYRCSQGRPQQAWGPMQDLGAGPL